MGLDLFTRSTVGWSSIILLLCCVVLFWQGYIMAKTLQISYKKAALLDVIGFLFMMAYVVMLVVMNTVSFISLFVLLPLSLIFSIVSCLSLRKHQIMEYCRKSNRSDNWLKKQSAAWRTQNFTTVFIGVLVWVVVCLCSIQLLNVNGIHQIDLLFLA